MSNKTTMNIKLILILTLMSSLYCQAATNDITDVILSDSKTANRKELESTATRLFKERKEQAEYLMSQFSDEKTSINAKGYII